MRLLIPTLLLLSACDSKAPEAPKVPAPPAQPSSPKPLTPEDRAQLEKQEAVVLKLLKSRYGGDVALKRSKDDLALLQKLLDDQALKPNQTYELQCLGVVLGHVFAAESPFRWVIAEDEYGRDPALQYLDTTILIFPLTMISKRVEQG